MWAFVGGCQVLRNRVFGPVNAHGDRSEVHFNSVFMSGSKEQKIQDRTIEFDPGSD